MDLSDPQAGELERRMGLLTPTQASEIVGVPAVQLCRWAYLGQGPRNSGTKHKPMFDEDDLQAWAVQKAANKLQVAMELAGYQRA